MAKELKKGSRGHNYVASEVQLLIELVRKNIHVVENKKTDAVSLEDKAKGWEELANEFNSVSNIHCRTASSLKEKWSGLKKESKKAAADDKLQREKTGGGPYKPPKMTKEYEEVLEILGAAGSGLQNEFDCDAAGKSNADTIEIVELTADMQEALQNIDFSKIVVKESEILSPTDKSWKSVTSSMLNTPKSAELKFGSGSINNDLEAEENKMHAPVNISKLGVVKKRLADTEAEMASVMKRRRPQIQTNEDVKKLINIKMELAQTTENHLLDATKRGGEMLAIEKEKNEREKREDERKETLFRLEKEKREMENEIAKLQLMKLKKECGLE